MRVRDLRFVRIVQRRRSASRPFRLARFAAIVVTLALATTAGVALLRPADAAGPGTGVLVYSDGVANSPWVRDWSGSTWSSPNSSAGIHQMRVLTGAASRTRNEMITVGTNLLFDIRGQMWNGSSWSQFSFGRLTQVTENDWWSQAVAYEGLSDQALLVWSNDTSSTTPVSYRTWNGSVWSAAGTVTAPFAGKARQMKLAASPDSDEMVLVVSDDSSRDYAVVWNGSSWGAAERRRTGRVWAGSDLGVLPHVERVDVEQRSNVQRPGAGEWQRPLDGLGVRPRQRPDRPRRHHIRWVDVAGGVAG